MERCGAIDERCAAIDAEMVRIASAASGAQHTPAAGSEFSHAFIEDASRAWRANKEAIVTGSDMRPGFTVDFNGPMAPPSLGADDDAWMSNTLFGDGAGEAPSRHDDEDALGTVSRSEDASVCAASMRARAQRRVRFADSTLGNVLDGVLRRPCECTGCFRCGARLTPARAQCATFGRHRCEECHEWRCTPCMRVWVCRYCKRS